MKDNDRLLIGSGQCVHSSSVMKERGGEVIANLTRALGSKGWVGYAGGVLNQRRDRTQGWAHLGWPPALQWQVMAGARGEREGRRAAPGHHPCRRRSSCPPLLPQQRSPPAGGRRLGTPPAPCGTAPGGAGGTAAEPPADEPPCCHLPPHSPPPLPPHRPEVTRQGSDSAGTLHGQTHAHTSNRQRHSTHIVVTQISTTH